VKRRSLEFRSQRPFEFRPDQSSPFTNVLFDDPLFRMYVIDRFNLWAFVDERDAAQALEKGLTANYEGDHVLFINDSSNSLGYNSRTLIRLFFPGVREFRNGLSGSSALVSIERARTLIGFEPEYSLQNTALS
jgi:nucleoside-diphosphate-sugar epimerase